MLIVQKFGGTSVGDLERIQNVANRVSESKKAGNDIVVVVSAMSGETNKLVGYAEHFSSNPSRAEMDMLLSSGERVTASLLSIALNEMGFSAVAMSGRKAGILTDSSHTKARIEEINTTNLKSNIDNGNIIIVAGFQGITPDGRVSTLGRGGSDLSAVAIAGAIKADICEIYTDVDGIYTTDPRIEPKAKKIDSICYDEILELSSLGAKVLQSRSVEMAKKFSVKLCTKNSFNDNEGTMIIKESENMENPVVSGIALDKSQTRLSMIGVKDKPGIIAELFTILGAKNINVDMIVQTTGHDGKANIDFTILSQELVSAKEALKKYDDGFDKIEYDENIAKASIVGLGMKSHTGVAGIGFLALSNENINILMVSTSEIKISIIVNEKYAELAVRSLHDVYKLDK